MSTVTIEEAKNSLDKLIYNSNLGFNPVTIAGRGGKSAVLISEQDWRNIEETLYLYSIPGFVENAKDILENEDWENAEEYDADAQW